MPHMVPLLRLGLALASPAAAHRRHLHHPPVSPRPELKGAASGCEVVSRVTGGGGMVGLALALGRSGDLIRALQGNHGIPAVGSAG